MGAVSGKAPTGGILITAAARSPATGERRKRPRPTTRSPCRGTLAGWFDRSVTRARPLPGGARVTLQPIRPVDLVGELAEVGRLASHALPLGDEQPLEKAGANGFPRKPFTCFITSTREVRHSHCGSRARRRSHPRGMRRRPCPSRFGRERSWPWDLLLSTSHSYAAIPQLALPRKNAGLLGACSQKPIAVRIALDKVLGTITVTLRSCQSGAAG